MPARLPVVRGPGQPRRRRRLTFPTVRVATPQSVCWTTAFVDLPRRSFDVGAAFWARVTGSAISPPRGDHEEFATLLPPDGDPYLRVQRLRGGPGGCHLDLHVEDMPAAAARAVGLGAEVERELDDVVVLRTPTGHRVCVVPDTGETVRPAPAVRPDGGRSLVDQVCLDLPSDVYEQACSFWAALTAWEHRPGARPEFTYLARPEGMPLRLLLQRVGRRPHPRRASAHLDLACDDVDAEVAHHRELGAEIDRRHESWTTMSDPAGLAYCLTSRSPDTGTR